MIAAIYARKSTEQPAPTPTRRASTRQIENARAFAAAKGWTVAEAHVYTDDAVSGAETRKLVNRQRLLDVIAGPAAVSGAHHAGRLALQPTRRRRGLRRIEGLAQAGVEIWFYQDGTRFTFGTFGDNIVGFVRAEMNAEYRRQIAKWTTEAMVRKAQGGTRHRRPRLRLRQRAGRRAHRAPYQRVAGRGHPPHLRAVRLGHRLHAHRETVERRARRRPAPQQGRPAGWSPSTVNEVLHRPLYRGEVVWNKTKKRDAAGTTAPTTRPEAEWLRFDRPELRIVSDEAWHAAHARLGGIRSQLATAKGGQAVGRRHDRDSKYLLS